jgi:hypothetical protein
MSIYNQELPMKLKIADGSISRPSVAFERAPTNGIYKVSGGIGFTNAGVKTAEISNSGISTTLGINAASAIIDGTVTCGPISSSGEIKTSSIITAPNITSGTYVPTATATNINLSTVLAARYQRINNIVTVYGKIYGSPTNATCSVGITLPTGPTLDFTGADGVVGNVVYINSASNLPSVGFCYSLDGTKYAYLSFKNAGVAAGWINYDLCYSIA